jgi:hypothetical protein
MCVTAFRRIIALLSVGIDEGRAFRRAWKPELIDLRSKISFSFGDRTGYIGMTRKVHSLPPLLLRHEVR